MLIEVEVYRMPESLGGDWAWSALGTISDGYASEDEARVAALWFVDASKPSDDTMSGDAS